MLRIPQAVGFLLDFVSILMFFQIAEIISVQKSTSRSYITAGISALSLSLVDLAANSSSLILGPLVYMVVFKRASRSFERTATIAFLSMLIISISTNASGLISILLTTKFAPYTTAFSQTIFIALNILCLLLLSQFISRLYTFIRTKEFRKFSGITENVEQFESLTVFTLTASFITVVIFTRYLRVQTVLLPYIILVVLIFIMLAAVVVGFLTRFQLRKIRAKYEQAKIKNLERYTANIQSQYNLLRKSKHEFRNAILSIMYMANDQTVDPIERVTQIDSFIASIIPNKDRPDSSMTFSPSISLIKDLSIKSIIIEKIFDASSLEKRILLNVENELPLSIYGPDINKVLGICLNNAIEASSPDDSAISLSLSYTNNFYEIIIVNHFSEANNLVPGSVTSDEFTTKGSRHGLGLAIAQKIVTQHDNFELNIEVVKNTFTISLFVKNIPE